MGKWLKLPCIVSSLGNQSTLHHWPHVDDHCCCRQGLFFPYAASHNALPLLNIPHEGRARLLPTVAIRHAYPLRCTPIGLGIATNRDSGVPYPSRIFTFLPPYRFPANTLSCCAHFFREPGPLHHAPSSSFKPRSPYLEMNDLPTPRIILTLLSFFGEASFAIPVISCLLLPTQ